MTDNLSFKIDNMESQLGTLELMQPEIMSEVDLRHHLSQRLVSPDLQRASKSALLDLWHRLVTPMSQRVYRADRAGRWYEQRQKRRPSTVDTCSQWSGEPQKSSLAAISRVTAPSTSTQASAPSIISQPVPSRLKPPPSSAECCAGSRRVKLNAVKRPVSSDVDLNNVVVAAKHCRISTESYPPISKTVKAPHRVAGGFTALDNVVINSRPRRISRGQSDERNAAEGGSSTPENCGGAKRRKSVDCGGVSAGVINGSAASSVSKELETECCQVDAIVASHQISLNRRPVDVQVLAGGVTGDIEGSEECVIGGAACVPVVVDASSATDVAQADFGGQTIMDQLKTGKRKLKIRRKSVSASTDLVTPAV